MKPVFSIIKSVLVVLLWLWAPSGFAQIDAFALRDLYAFRELKENGEYKDKNRVVFVMTMAPHGKLQQVDDVFSPNAKYVITIAKDAEPKKTSTISVYPGANSQYTVYFDDAHQIVAKIGRYGANGDYQAYLGIKGDSRFYDETGFKNLLLNPCVPVFGLRCSLTDFVENAFEPINVGVFAATVPIKWLTGEDNPEAGTVRVWGQSYRRVEEPNE